MSQSTASLKFILGALVAGLMMGAGLVISAMINPMKVIGFLDLFGQWDPSLAFVMIGALAVYTPAYWLFAAKREQSLLKQKFQLPTAKDIDCKLLIGAILFGLGWGLAGICPGPSLVLISSGEVQVLYFVAAMFAGFWLAPKWLKLMGKS